MKEAEVPTTTKPRKLSPVMIDALDGFLQAGQLRSGILSRWEIGQTNTLVALIDRGLLSTSGGSRRGVSRHQITPAGCKAIGHSMDEVVAAVRDMAIHEYFEHETLQKANLMVELPIEIGAVVEVGGMRGTVTSRYQDNWWIDGPNDSEQRCVGARLISRVIELAPAPADTRLSFEDAWIDAVSMATTSTELSKWQLASKLRNIGAAERDGLPRTTRPAGTPAGEKPYLYSPIDKAAILAKPIDSLLHSGVIEAARDPLHVTARQVAEEQATVDANAQRLLDEASGKVLTPLARSVWGPFSAADMLRQVVNGIEAGLRAPCAIFPNDRFDMQFGQDTTAEMNQWAARFGLPEATPTNDHRTWMCWETRGDFHGLQVVLWCSVDKNVTESVEDIVDAEVIDEPHPHRQV